MKKKLLSVLLCTAMLTTVLAGCGSGNDGGSAPAPEAPAADESADASAAEAPAASSDEPAEIYVHLVPGVCRCDQHTDRRVQKRGAERDDQL